MPDKLKKRFNIWMITKWYPNREDPQLGVFIQKHVKAISKYNNISVLYIHSLIDLSKNFEVDETEINGLKEIQIYFKKDTSVFGKIINGIRYLSALNKGFKILNIRNSEPHIFHAYILTRTGLIAWYLSRRKKIPFIISEQWSGFVTGKFLKSSQIKKMTTRFVAKRASSITCVSSFLLNHMKECGLYNSAYQVIPNVIENTANNSLSTNKNQINVLMVADLVDEIKNISSVIRMIGELKDDVKFKLQIIGSGPDEKELKKLAASFNLINRIIFFEGLKNNIEVYSYLKECDFLIMNSRFETFSLICAEAMSCGKPVLATRCGGPNEFVNSTTGILIETDNNAELMKEFKYMLLHFQNFDSNHIKNYANSLFSADKVGMAFQNVYSSIIKTDV